MLFFLLSLWITPTEAGLLQRCADPFIRSIKDKIIDRLVNNSEGETLSLTDQRTGKAFNLQLGKLLGTGWYGAVYHIESVDHSDIPRIEGMDLVAKFPHSLVFNQDHTPVHRTEMTVQRENRVFGYLKRHVRKILKASHFPKDPAWTADHLPLVPIVASIPTERGTLLFKYEVHGMTLKDIGRKYGKDMPAEMVAGLRDIYELTQAMHEAVKIRDRHGHLVGFSLDIKATNVIWISKPEVLAAFGFKKDRPGFLMMEMDMTLNNIPHYIDPNTSFPEYLADFQNYLISEAKRD